MDKQFAIFDMDGTLLDSMIFWKNLASEYLCSNGVKTIPGDILERINGCIKEQLSTVRIGIALRTIGIERVRSGNARGYRLVEISPEQININQRAMGSFTDINTDTV